MPSCSTGARSPSRSRRSAPTIPASRSFWKITAACCARRIGRPRPTGWRHARARSGRARLHSRGGRGSRRDAAPGAGRGAGMIVTTAAEMRALDQWTIAHGTPGHVLMERAGAGAARVLRERFPGVRGRVVVICGRGNNGGDGFVVAGHLKRASFAVETWLLGRPEAVRGDAARMLAAWRRAGGRVESLTDAGRLPALRTRLARAALVVDALLGTGLEAPVEGLTAAVIEAINAARAPVLAVDLPSGLSADTGRPLGTAVRAAATATFGFAKVGLCIHPGVEHAGALTVVDIGIPPAAVAAVGPQTTLLEPHEVGRLLPRRRRDAHTGNFGHVLDADWFNAVAGTELRAARAVPTVVTPHPGEMARLVGTDTAAVQADRLGTARRLAAATGAVAVLKGAPTVIASPDGTAAICPAGNPGMASGGTGDVLAGIVGGLLAQGLAPADAAALAVFAHGLAGDQVAARRGEVGLLARDLLAELPAALAHLQAAAEKDARGGA